MNFSVVAPLATRLELLLFADGVFTKVDSPDPVAAGQHLTYVLTARNVDALSAIPVVVFIAARGRLYPRDTLVGAPKWNVFVKGLGPDAVRSLVRTMTNCIRAIGADDNFYPIV